MSSPSYSIEIFSIKPDLDDESTLVSVLPTTGSAPTALARTTASVFAILEETLRAGTREIQLVAAQDAIADPPASFEVRRLR